MLTEFTNTLSNTIFHSVQSVHSNNVKVHNTPIGSVGSVYSISLKVVDCYTVYKADTLTI